MTMRIAHIINPVRVGPQSDLFEAQPYVWEAMRVARDFARDVADVELIAVTFAEDAEIVPDWLKRAEPLTRSAVDLPGFSDVRRLPFLADVLARGVAAAPDADYIVYSNADIIVMPFAYRFIAERLAAGVEAMTINRRTIPADTGSGGLAAIWAAVGERHEGHDFFVFSRSVYDRLQLDEVLIGVPYIGWTLNSNIAVLSSRYEYYPDTVVLTKHLGNDKTWQADDRKGLRAHNLRAADRAFAALGATRKDMSAYVAGFRPKSERRRRKRFVRPVRWLMNVLRSLAKQLRLI